jgi:Uma2 family endonuclease
MTIATSSAAFTPEDLLQLEDEGLFELVDGQLVEKKMGYLAGKTVSLISHVLMIHLEKSPGGEVASEVTFQCFPRDPEQVRHPDIVFFTAGRAGAIPDEGHVKIPPDLAIEIISPGDRINEFENKLADYRSADIKLVWEVNPTVRFVRVHHPNRKSELLEENDTLTGEDVLPGFTVRVDRLIPPR